MSERVFEGLSWRGHGGGSPQRRSETCRANEYSKGSLGGGMGAVAPNAGARLDERTSIRMALLAGVWGR